jgi:hypothetical protein
MRLMAAVTGGGAEIMPMPVGDHVCIHSLESRLLFAAAASSFNTSYSALGNVLTINGTNASDAITVSNTTSGLKISNGSGWSTYYTGPVATIRINGNAGNDRLWIDANIRTGAILSGGSGIDTLVGGSGNDSLYGGDGRDYLYGFAGNDTIVSLGDGSVDRLYGGAGFDGFWGDMGSDEIIVDATTDEISGGAIHRVGSFLSGAFGSVTLTAPMNLYGQQLADPTINSDATGYRNFSDRPLFSKNGPSPDDISQGSVGDCYLLASLGSIAKANAQSIRQSVVELGDGTFAVQFDSGGTRTYVRVDGDLPVFGNYLAYANLGKQQSIWAAIIEKAYAFFRYGQGSYESLSGGFMNDVYRHMGFANPTSLFSASDSNALLQKLQADLASGKAVTLGTKTDVAGLPIMGGHAYMVDAVLTDSTGRFTGLRLRNPWGTDDVPGNGANDGYITITAQQAYEAFWFACATNMH